MWNIFSQVFRNNANKQDGAGYGAASEGGGAGGGTTAITEEQPPPKEDQKQQQQQPPPGSARSSSKVKEVSVPREEPALTQLDVTARRKLKRPAMNDNDMAAAAAKQAPPPKSAKRHKLDNAAAYKSGGGQYSVSSSQEDGSQEDDDNENKEEEDGNAATANATAFETEFTNQVMKRCKVRKNSMFPKATEKDRRAHLLHSAHVQVNAAGALITQALFTGPWPSPSAGSVAAAAIGNRCIQHQTHMSMVGASLRQFCRDTILPSIVLAVTENPDRKMAFAKAAFVGTCLMLREVLIQNSVTIFGLPNFPESQAFSVRVMTTAVILQALDHEAASTRRRFLQAVRSYDAGDEIFAEHLFLAAEDDLNPSNSTTSTTRNNDNNNQNNNNNNNHDNQLSNGQQPQQQQQQEAEEVISANPAQASFKKHARRHPLCGRNQLAIAEANAVHVTILQSAAETKG